MLIQNVIRCKCHVTVFLKSLKRGKNVFVPRLYNFCSFSLSAVFRNGGESTRRVWCSVLIWQQNLWYHYEVMFSPPTHYVLSWLRFCFFPFIIDFFSTVLGSQNIWEEGAEICHVDSASAYTQPPLLSTSPSDGTCVTADKPVLTRHHSKAMVYMVFTLVLYILWVWTSV